MWLNELKIAIIEQNTKKLASLLEEVPTFETRKEIDEALCLTREASGLLTILRDETLVTMKKMKKNIDFLNSATANKTAKFDIIS